MNFIGKKGEAYKCFADFKNGNNAKEYQQFVDIFLPMLFQENNNRLEISVGKKISESQFVSWLSVVANKFNVMPIVCDNNPQLVIKDCANRSAPAIVSLNISTIKDLHIETEKTTGFFRHNICFNYNEVDYQMHIIINNERT